MSIAAADLHKAVNALWDAQGLDAHFTALWDSGVVASEFIVLHDGEAAPGQPFPYCVYEFSAGAVSAGMSGAAAGRREIRDVPCAFRIHARAVDGDPRTSKQIAAALAEEVMKVFGGHPSVSPQTMSLDNGNFLISRCLNDFGVRTGDDEWSWTISYEFREDVPVAV